MEILKTSHEEFNQYEHENGVNHFEASKVTPEFKNAPKVTNLVINSAPSAVTEKYDIEAKSGQGYTSDTRTAADS